MNEIFAARIKPRLRHSLGNPSLKRVAWFKFSDVLNDYTGSSVLTMFSDFFFREDRPQILLQPDPLHELHRNLMAAKA